MGVLRARLTMLASAIYVSRFLIWLLMWTFCITVSILFIHSTFVEYQESDPITTTTFIDGKPKPDPVIVKICNSVFLDAQKILKYNGTEFNYDAYEFLYEAVSGNFLFDDSKWVVSTSVNDMFFLSNNVLDAFRLDVDMFLGTCYVVGSYRNCIPDFEWHLDVETSCYQAQIDLGGYGRNRALKLGFFFNPDIQLGKYISLPGVYVTFFHPRDYIPYSSGFYVVPKDFVVVSATTEHKVQKASFEKAKCFEPDGPQFYNFTGGPFEVEYNTEYCSNLCFAEAYYNECDCSPFYGMNQTNSECLEEEEKRLCLKHLGAFPEKIENSSKECLTKSVLNTSLQKFFLKKDNKIERRSNIKMKTN